MSRWLQREPINQAKQKGEGHTVSGPGIKQKREDWFLKEGDLRGGFTSPQSRKKNALKRPDPQGGEKL